MADQGSERRGGDRLDLQLRVRYSAAAVTGEGEATDVSPRGARMEAAEMLEPGTRLSFTLDAGDGKGVNGTGSVSWCRPRTVGAGRTVYDVGVRFDDDWLKGDRGPLARALSRFFAVTDVEPARDAPRVATRLRAKGQAPQGSSQLTILDLGEGGMRVTVAEGDLPPAVKVGAAVTVGLGNAHPAGVEAVVAWVQEGSAQHVHAQFGVQFKRVDDALKTAVAAVLSAAVLGGETPTVTLDLV